MTLDSSGYTDSVNEDESLNDSENSCDLLDSQKHDFSEENSLDLVNSLEDNKCGDDTPEDSLDIAQNSSEPSISNGKGSLDLLNMSTKDKMKMLMSIWFFGLWCNFHRYHQTKCFKEKSCQVQILLSYMQKGFKMQVNFVNHMKTEHKGSKLKCTLCPKEFLSPNGLFNTKDHMST